MFEVSQLVLYSGHGICCIVGTEDRVVDRKPVSYYVLEPVTQPGTKFFVPSHNPAALAKMRHPLEKDRLIAILSDSSSDLSWVSDENRRKQLYRQILSSGDATSMIGMLRLLEQHRKTQIEAGRKIHICDENFMRDASKILSAEISLVLQLSQEESTACLQRSISV